MARDPVYYADYLKLPTLLSLQSPESGKVGAPMGDEYLFIIVHQAYELWFKQVLIELDAVLDGFSGPAVAERELGRFVGHLERVAAITRLMLAQIDVLETMTALDFLDFRDLLVPASGFQSAQFRSIENKLGLDPRTRMTIHGAHYTSRLSPEDKARAEAAEAAPSIRARVDAWLARIPFLEQGGWGFRESYRAALDATLTREAEIIAENPMLDAIGRGVQEAQLAQNRAHFEALFDADAYEALRDKGERTLSHRAFLAALFINLYRDEPILHLPYRLLKALMDVDEGFTTWRYRHALMVSRMIGTRVGTGGTSGHEYLRTTAEKHKVFSDLFALSTYMLPRSKLPRLPASVEGALGFRSGVSAG